MRDQLTLFNTDKSFHNTIKEKGEELQKSEWQARTQEEKVLDYFKTFRRATALDAADFLGFHESSVRRSVTNLYKRGLLRKTDQQVVGRYGKKNYLFEIL